MADFQLNERDDKSATNSGGTENALHSFAQGLAYGLVEEPYEGLRQLVGAGTPSSQEQIFSAPKPDSSIADFAGKAGNVAGMLPWVIGINKVVHAGSLHLGLAAETLPATASFGRVAMPVLEVGLTGAIDRGVFAPSNGDSNIGLGRLTNAINGFALFGSAAALSMGLRSSASGLLDSEAATVKPFYSHAVNAGIYGGAGFGTGLIAAGLNKVEGRAPTSMLDVTEYGLLGAVTGGIAKSEFNSTADSGVAARLPDGLANRAGIARFADKSPLAARMSKYEGTDEMAEKVDAGTPTAKMRSGVNSDTLYAGPSPEQPPQIDPLLKAGSGRDVVADVKTYDAMRAAQGDSLPLSDEYMRAANEFGARGKAGFADMMANLDKSLDIRSNLLAPDDPLLGTSYRYAYNVSAGKVPAEVSIRYLDNSMKVWEQLAAQHRLPGFVNDHYLNTGYKNLSILYKGTQQPELAAEAAAKIKQ